MNNAGRKVVITGASGHIGSHVASKLREAGVSVNLLVRRVNPHINSLVRQGVICHIGDLFKPETFAPVLKNADCLFHLAAENTTSHATGERVLQSTVNLTRSLLRAAGDAGVRTVVYTSSVVVLGRSQNPNRLLVETDRTTVCESPYVRGKVEADNICEELISRQQMDIRRMYPSWVVGPGDLRGTPPHEVINRFLRKGQPCWFNGGISIAAVEAVAEAHVAAWLMGRPRESYVLGGDNITFQKFFELLAEITKTSPPRIGLPKWFLVAAAQMLALGLRPLGRKPPLDPEYAKTVLGSFSWYDSRKAVRELRYRIPVARESLVTAVLNERRRLAGTLTLGLPAAPTVPVHVSVAEEAPPLLITGVPGWLGNRFVDVLTQGQFAGRSLPHRKIRLLVEKRNADLLQLPKPFEVVCGDICDPASVHAALDGIGTVFHLAGAIYPPKHAILYRVNVDGTRNLVDQCIRRGVRRVLYMSTDSTCGHGSREQRLFDEHTPDNPYRHYGRSKWLAERYILEQSASGKIDGTSLRGFWFFGPFAPERQQRFLNLMRQHRQIVFGNGENFRSVSHVDNTIAAFLAAENSPRTFGKWYWIGDAKPDYTVDEIYATLCAAAGTEYRPLYIPGAFCSFMRLADSLLAGFGRLHPTIHGISKFDFDIAGCTNAAQRDFGYVPVTSLKEYAATVYGDSLT